MLLLLLLTEIKYKLTCHLHRKYVILIFLSCCLFTYKTVGEASKHAYESNSNEALVTCLRYFLSKFRRQQQQRRTLVNSVSLQA